MAIVTIIQDIGVVATIIIATITVIHMVIHMLMDPGGRV